MQEPAEIRGEVEHVSFRNEDNGWTVLKMRQDGDQRLITVTGNFTAIRAGEHFQLFGAWSQHPSYGAQFKAERCVATRPNTKFAIKRYLGSGLIKGIGDKTAAKIVEHFGLDTFDVLDNEPDRLKEVPSIGKKKKDAIVEAWKENKAGRDIEMFLNNHGLSPLLAAKIIKTYGKGAISIVSRDPYRLAVDIRGIGFLSADKIAQRIGIAADSAERIRAATVYQLGQSEDRGHCYLSTAQLITELVATLQISEEQLIPKLADALNELNRAGSLVSERYTTEAGEATTAHYLQDVIVAEAGVANKIARMLLRPLVVDGERVDNWLERYAERSGTPLSQTQLAAVKKAVSNRVFVLTGGPGVGKTTTANAIIRLLFAMGRSVALAAPTGRAAQRLSEVSAVEAKTIHRLLEWAPHTGGFTRDDTNPLTAQAVVVDEASMLDIRLANALFQAIPETSQIILIGDVDQLPSVGPGNVLRDLIESERVPFCRLTEIFRQAATSRIVQAAHAINIGRSPEFSDDQTSDCRFIAVDTPEAIREVITDLMTEVLPDKCGYDPVRQTQILTPMNRGDLGTQILNETMQELLNPKRSGSHEYNRGSFTLRSGDKVIQSANNYELGVFNGDIGFVEHAGVEGGKVKVSFGDRVVTYDSDNVGDLRLAYAITIHKSQGSEFPVVIIPLAMQHYIMLQRNLIYTALTRAKKLAIFVGTAKALGQAVRTQTSNERQTMLIDRVRGEMASL